MHSADARNSFFGFFSVFSISSAWLLVSSYNGFRDSLRLFTMCFATPVSATQQEERQPQNDNLFPPNRIS